MTRIFAKIAVFFADTGTFARAIVAKRVGITAGTAAVLGLLVALKVIPVGLSTQVSGELAVIFTGLVAIVGAFWAQTGTTPADLALKPVSSNGKPLAEVTMMTAGIKQATDVLTDPPSHTFGGGTVADPPPGTTLAP